MEIITELFNFILHIDVRLAELARDYGVWVYGILFLIVFCETGLVVTPFLPGDSLLFAAGALAGGALAVDGVSTAGMYNVHLLAVLLFIAAVVGDAVNYITKAQG
jgi:membrane-associated protein